MLKKTKSIITILLLAMVVFTSLPAMEGSIDAHAVSTPKKVTTFTATTYSSSSIGLTWKKPSACSGYAIYMNGKYLRVVPSTWTAYNVPKLKAATSYKFTIRAYNTYKKKQYYNTRLKKWVDGRPYYKYWVGKKTRTVTAYKYGAMSAAKTATTGPAKVTGLKSTAKTYNTTTIAWTKQTKALTGYVVYRNNAYYKTLGKNTNTLKVTGLKANTKYTYKVRSYLKVGSKNVYGAWSANLAVTTAKAPAATTTTTVQDTKFKNSSMANKTLYTDKDNSYAARSWTLATSKEDNADAIKWSSSNTSVVTITKALWNGTEAELTIKGKGTATITATNWDGQKKTATVTVKASTDSSSDTGNTSGSQTTTPANTATFKINGSAPGKIDKSGTKTVSVTLPGSDYSVSWTSSNPDAVSVSGSETASLSAGDTFGIAQIIGTLIVPSGASYNGPTTVSFIIQNVLYPTDSSGAYVMTVDSDGWPIVGGVWQNSSPEQVILRLPRDAKIKMDIDNINSVCADWEAYGYGFLLGRGHEISTTTPNKVYISGNYVYFYEAGTGDLTIDGIRREFTFTGRNDALCDYFEFVEKMAQGATGATTLDKLQSITKYIASSANFSYGRGMNPANMYRTKIGDCINGAGMAKDIFEKMGYKAGYYRPSSNSTHQDVYVVIDGMTYYANCTPGSDAGTFYWIEDGVKKYNW